VKITQIRPGKFYETTLGIGECVRAGRTWPPSAQFRITHPTPRGIVNVKPRDVLREVQA